MKKKVMIFREVLIPPSETFIVQQVASMQRCQPILVGIERWDPAKILNSLRHVVLKEKLFPIFLIKKIVNEHTLCQLAVGLYYLISRPQVIHIHFATDAYKLSRFIHAVNVPVFITIHGYDVTTYAAWWKSGAGGDSMRQFPDGLRNLAKLSHVHFVAVSDELADRVSTEHGIPRNKMITRYTGINTSLFKPSIKLMHEREENVLFVGRLVEKKGLTILLQAMAIVQKQLPTAKLLVIGEGPLMERHKEEATSLNINVDFLGRKSSEDIARYMENSRIFCLPSIRAKNGDSEGFGMVLLEAQACGLPVITSALGGRSEGLQHDITGFAFEEGDVEKLSEYLITLLSDTTLNQRVGDAGVRFVNERYNLDKCTQEIEDLYIKS